MKLHARLIETFHAVMTVGTVTAAAAVLRTSQPAVSRSIRQLEDAVGLILFDRVRGRLLPTAQGLALFEEVRKSFIGIEQIGQAAAALRNQTSGHLSIVCAPALSHGFIAAAARRFLARHAGVTLTIETQTSSIIAEWLRSQRFDLGLAAYPGAVAGARSTEFAAPNEVCILPASHPMAGESLIRLADLDNQPFIYLASADPYRRRLEAALATAGAKPRMMAETPNSATLCALVREGVGIGIANPLTALDHAAQGLVLRPIDIALPFAITLLRAQHRPSSPLVERFIADLSQTRDDFLARAASLCQEPG